ncbi:hypothetical protein [Streptosporangium sandarakinum]|uniref:hypothetical protein n=1 Tax=Streptosporangium sandarakinum TaxID=1260955 RepID=UPI0033BAE6FF
MVILATVLSVLISGCMVSSSPLRVPPPALDNVRSIGKVWAETSTENEKDGRRQIENLLIIDVGAASKREALDKASALLVARKWTVSAENRPTIVSMKCTKWKDVTLVLRPFHPAYFEEYPEILNKLKGLPTEEKSLVYIEIFDGVI